MAFADICKQHNALPLLLKVLAPRQLSMRGRSPYNAHL
jgi:hypothetical protein